ncbi:hypothetical protein [Shinella zoogloeoides]|uniref:hypothetical protein n=1 Tax=Shinella zoogloeoides TaxID=352475 RepID=UPI000E653064|nr:hypothetical protein [Shinella zoogloeoides]WPE21692.1 hypothetical protein ShzoTeo12_28970 [Shinella zoogloeoides]
MPHRTKKDAQVRLDLGVARVSALEGDTPRESLEALKTHLENVDALERSEKLAANDESAGLARKKTCE